MRIRPWILVPLLAALATACSSTSVDVGAPTPENGETAVVEAAYRTATSRGGGYVLGWRPFAREDVPVNDYFELEVWLAPADAPDERITNAELVVSAWMPGHGHGMNTKPKAVADAPTGTYRVKGMLFHMGGFWQLFFDVVRDGSAERAEFELNL